MAVTRSIVEALPPLLAELERPGEFYGLGACDLPVVRLHVDGVGALGLPVPAEQAEALARIAEPAPYGRGAETLLDPNVRRCGQIAAARVHADDPRWARTLDGIVVAAAAALGVEGAVSAQLYKLLVYQPGDFFAEHRDTEKAPGMFGTLVVVLPSEHAGGEIVVRHDGRAATLDLAPDDLGQARWAAFYADCQHELRPLRSGVRLALVYNLLRAPGRAPRVPDIRPTVAQVAKALRAWEAEPDSPRKVVYPLKHAYSLAELSFGALKNEDAATADVLVAACAETDFVLRLAIVSIEESGSAEPIQERRTRGWGRAREPERTVRVPYEVIEVHDRVQSLDAWRRPDDAPEPLGRIPYEDDEIAPPDALADEEPDEDHFHEASGNEGCSFERAYRRAALVLWPASRELAVLHQGGPAASLAVLERLLDSDLARADVMAAIVVAGWEPSAGTGALRARLVADLARLPDVTHLGRFLLNVVCDVGFDGAETDAVAASMARFDDPTAADLVLRVATTHAAHRLAPVARLLRTVATTRPGAIYAGALEAVVRAIPRVGEGVAAWVEHGSGIRSRPSALVDLVHAAGACGDEALARQLVEAVLERRARWPMDSVVVPAVVALPRAGSGAFEVAERGLREAALDHLRARMALPLAPPPDATRSTEGLTCTCGDCASVRAFLAHPTEQEWSLKAAKAQRQHVESHLRAARSDVDMRTDARGNPHSLVCTKNQASYDARVKEREADAASVARMT